MFALSGGLGRELSGRHGRQLDDRIVAQRCHGFQRHIAGALDGPLVVLLEQDGADEAGDRLLVREDADDFGSALDLAVEAFQRVGAVDLGPVVLGEAHEGQHIGLGLIHQGGELRDLGPELVGDPAPLGPGGFGILLDEGGADEGGDDTASLLAGVASTLGMKWTRQRCQVACSTLDTAAFSPSCASEITSLTPRRPRRASERRKSVQKVSASDAPIAMPSTSRLPSPLTATATMTATETTRPLCARLHIGRIEPEIGPVAFERPVEERLDLAVDLFAQTADLALRDSGHAHWP